MEFVIYQDALFKIVRFAEEILLVANVKSDSFYKAHNVLTFALQDSLMKMEYVNLALLNAKNVICSKLIAQDVMENSLIRENVLLLVLLELD